VDRSQYYKELKELAQEVRRKYQLATPDISLSAIRNIYKDEKIILDYWNHKLKKLRAAYMLLDGVPHVMLNGQIKPKEPRIFSLCHELKHHYRDQEILKGHGYMGCQDISWSDGSPVEIGAEIFAAEFIYPEAEFLNFIKDIGIRQGNCSKEQVVQLKRDCGAPVSYAFVRKRLEWFHIIKRGTFDGIQFQKLEDEIYGVPWWKTRRTGSRSVRPSRR
jgi:Zn-dependent peptidase ImmA (M78 family)